MEHICYKGIQKSENMYQYMFLSKVEKMAELKVNFYNQKRYQYLLIVSQSQNKVMNLNSTSISYQKIYKKVKTCTHTCF